MAFYILKSGLCLAIFYGFYKLVLEKESFHVFKRFYLLVSAVFAFVIPLITFTEYIEVIPQEAPLFFPNTPITNTIIEAKPINYIPIILWSIYGLGVLLFSFKFLKNLSGLIIKIKRNPKFKNQSFINVLLLDLVIPHTFFSYIFLNKQKFETHQIPKEVLLHEETHAKQKHSLDVLFIEILQIQFWFNPIIYFIKHSIKLNHEFLADQGVLRKGTEPLKYQSLLLAFSSPDSYRDAKTHQLTNAINYSSIKKRLTVMETQTPKKAFWLRSLILLPLLAILIYSFSEKKVIEKENQENSRVDNLHQFINSKLKEGASEALMQEYKSIISEIETTHKIWGPSFNRTIAIYDLMTDEQRNSVKKYPEIPNLMLSRIEVKPKTPSSKEFDSWKNSSEFAIWIDEKHVNNTELNNYNVSDIKYFTTSFVYNNARSVKFPQPHQNHLYTEKGLEETYLKSNAKKYNSLKAEYLKAIEENTINSDEQKILKAQMDRAFDNLTNEEIEKYNVIKETSNSTTKPN